MVQDCISLSEMLASLTHNMYIATDVLAIKTMFDALIVHLDGINPFVLVNSLDKITIIYAQALHILVGLPTYLISDSQETHEHIYLLQSSGKRSKQSRSEHQMAVSLKLSTRWNSIICDKGPANAG
jgi:hypothetical protein